MLTVDHVKVRRRAGVVHIVPLCGLAEARALELAGVVVDTVRAHEGEPREVLEEALDALPMDAAEVRFGRGLKKLALDACAFDVDSDVRPDELRAEVFLEAARARREARFDRTEVLAAAASARGMSPDDVERALYADLAAAHTVRGFDVQSPLELVERYRGGELQAPLLRAQRIVVDLTGNAAELRAVLRTLKLHQLLFELQPLEEGLRLVVEGPMGLFQQSTRYGLKLAMLLPVLLCCRQARIEAHVRLRKTGGVERLVIEHTRPTLRGSDEVPLGDVASRLLLDLEAAGPPWRPRAAADILRLPGVGAIVPDLELVHDDTGEVVAVEVLGFWSRAAVWKRVELVEQGLPFRLVCCASERLRVSEEALPDDATGALVVFKGSLRAAQVRAAADRVTSMHRPASEGSVLGQGGTARGRG